MNKSPPQEIQHSWCDGNHIRGFSVKCKCRNDAYVLKGGHELEMLLAAARCPNSECTDGVVHNQVGEEEWEAEQCQWCFERASILAPTDEVNRDGQVQKD